MRGLVGLVVFSLLVASCFANHKNSYGVMIDAGSSGSRIYIYQWVHRVNSTLPDLATAPLNQTQWSLKASPGLSSLANNLAGIPGHLQPLIDYALTNLPASEVSVTPIFLKATGGLRALPVSVQEQLIAGARAYLRSTSFSFQDSNAQVISLQTEALYGWICANYLSGAFGTGEIVGGLDMGGESTEISFLPSPGTPILADSINAQLGTGHNYTVYATGYNQRGLDASLYILSEYLTKDAVAATPVKNPCYLKGYSEVFYNAATKKNYTLVGSYDGTCQDLVRQVLLNTSVPCPISPCAFEGKYQPALPSAVTFYAYSGFTYTYNALFGGQGKASLRQYNNVSRQFCNASWDAAKVTYPKEGSKFLKTYCYTSSYMIQLLRTFGFGEDTTSIFYASTIKNIEVSWALGAMLYESALIAPSPNPQLSSTGSASTTGTGTTDSASTTGTRTTGSASTTTGTRTSGSASTTVTGTPVITNAASTTVIGVVIAVFCALLVL